MMDSSEFEKYVEKPYSSQTTDMLAGSFLLQHFQLNEILTNIKSAKKDINNLFFNWIRITHFLENPDVKKFVEGIPQGEEIVNLVESFPIRKVRKDLDLFYEKISRVENITGNMAREINIRGKEWTLIPIENILKDFAHGVRLLSNANGKRVKLFIQGGEHCIDSRLVTALGEVLKHLGENALLHGIESPSERMVSGKSPEGRISLDITSSGNRLKFVFCDDGRGINMEGIKKKIASTGISHADSLLEMDEREFLDRFFMEKEGIQGETGLKKLKIIIEKVRGDIFAETRLGEFTRITFYLPFSLSVMEGLMVRTSMQNFALPLFTVEQVIIITSNQIRRKGKRDMIQYEGNPIIYGHLSDILGLDRIKSDKNRFPCVILRFGNRPFALGLDRVEKKIDMVVQELGEHLRNVRFFSGCTLLREGIPVLILDVAEVVRTIFRASRSRMIPQVHERVLLPVLILDPFVSSRLLLQSLLESENIRTIATPDVQDARELLEYSRFSTLVMDIELHEEDWEDFLRCTKNNEIQKGISIILVTAVSDDKAIRKAYELGVRGYMVKSEFNQERFLKMVKSCRGE